MVFNKSIISGIVVSLVIGFGLGVVAGWQMNAKKVAELKQFFPPVPEFTTLSGTVKSVEGDVLVVEAIGLPSNPFEKLPTIRRVKVDKNSQLVKLVSKDQKEYEKELADYQKKISALPLAGATPVIPPQPFKEEKAALKDLKAGTFISVEAGENIKTKVSFVAKRIVVQPVGPVAAAPGPAVAPLAPAGPAAPVAPVGSPAAAGPAVSPAPAR